jgi:hypothetical protein
VKSVLFIFGGKLGSVLLVWLLRKMQECLKTTIYDGIWMPRIKKGNLLAEILYTFFEIYILYIRELLFLLNSEVP